MICSSGGGWISESSFMSRIGLLLVEKYESLLLAVVLFIFEFPRNPWKLTTFFNLVVVVEKDSLNRMHRLLP